MKEDLICGVAILLYLVLGNYIPVLITDIK